MRLTKCSRSVLSEKKKPNSAESEGPPTLRREEKEKESVGWRKLEHKHFTRTGGKMRRG